jgi:hypothetical protein
MYGLSVESNDASIVLKTNSLDKACELFKANGIETMSNEEIASL